jgi:cytochrome P450
MALLSISAFCTVCAAAIIWQAVYQIVYYRYLHPLSKIPGPFWGSTTRLWYTWINFKGSEVSEYRKLHAKYGPVVRISPTMVLVSDATTLPTIYHRYADKSDYYVPAGLGTTPSIINMQESSIHAHHRKITAVPYSFTNVKRMETLMDEQIQRWIDKLDAKFAAGKQQFDFSPWAVYMAYDVISSIAFGTPFGFVDQEKDVGGLIKSFHDGTFYLAFSTRLYPFTKLLKRVLPEAWLLPNADQDWGIGALMKFGKGLIQQREKDIQAGLTAGRVDILQTLLDYRDEDGKPLNMDYVEAEVLLVLAAGADTTGSVLQALLFQIFKRPAIYEKLVAELREVDAAGKLSKMPQWDEVTACCPYYIACIRETLRMNPPATGLMPRVAPEGGYELLGSYIPGGTEVTCHIVISNRDPDVFGADADEFRPERWLDEENAKTYQKYIATWGYGARICLGRDIAMMELMKAPLQFLRTFNPRVVDSQKPARKVFTGVVNYYRDFHMTIERREVKA